MMNTIIIQPIPSIVITHIYIYTHTCMCYIYIFIYVFVLYIYVHMINMVRYDTKFKLLVPNWIHGFQMPGLLPPRAAHARLRAAGRGGQGRGRGGDAGVELPMHGDWDQTTSATENLGISPPNIAGFTVSYRY